jgi:4-diphosphocytidyl-2-C-methyl-D-erythritol kinase
MFRAYAKINLGLYVVKRRPDGFHDIETVFHRVDIADTIRLTLARDITVTSSSAEAPSDPSNICHGAASLLRSHLGVTQGVHIHIDKQIPVGAGLGGGSADAACVLRELPAIWGATVPDQVLYALALKLGSDVPFFLSPGSAVARGRGEILEFFTLDIPYTALLCNPNVHVSTAWAYGQIHPGTSGKPENLRHAVEVGMKNPSLLSRTLRNDFEPIVFAAYPVVQDVKRRMMDAGALFALMSGSGSTVYGLFADPGIARKTAASLQALGYRTFITDPSFMR